MSHCMLVTDIAILKHSTTTCQAFICYDNANLTFTCYACMLCKPVEYVGLDIADKRALLVKPVVHRSKPVWPSSAAGSYAGFAGYS